MRAVILLVLAVGISGCTGLLVSDSRSRVPVMEQDESTGRSPRDNAIAAEIEQNLGMGAHVNAGCNQRFDPVARRLGIVTEWLNLHFFGT